MMIEGAKLKRGYRIMDVGGGLGYISLYCAKERCEVYHVDIDKNLIHRAKEISSKYGVKDINYIRASAENLPFIQEFLDVVFCGEVLEHLSEDEKAIRDANRVLKPSGLYIITTPNYNALPYILLRNLPYSLRLLIFNLFKVNVKYHAEIIGKRLRGHLAHRRCGYIREELELKLMRNGFEIEGSKGFGFLMPRVIASKIPPLVYKLIHAFGSIFPSIASKHLIIGKNKNKSRIY